MAVSKTKYPATDAEIIALFARHGIHGVTRIAPLGDGEFNAVYQVCTATERYALKIAPPDSARVVNFEHGMMRAEVYWYEQIRLHTDIAMPTIIAADFTRQDIAADCFIMTCLDAKPLYQCGFTEAEYFRAQAEKIAMLAKIHRVKGEGFGYVQKGLHPSWYAAIRAMTANLISDCEALGKSTPDGVKLLGLIDAHREILEKAPCRMVNFDLWDSNVLYGGGRMYWIDPERSYYGDPIADFLTLGAGPMTPLHAKQPQLDVYNRTAAEPIQPGRAECIRYAVAVGYLALIEEVEKYVRYEPDNPVYIRNTQDARAMYDMAFAVLV